MWTFHRPDSWLVYSRRIFPTFRNHLVGGGWGSGRWGKYGFCHSLSVWLWKGQENLPSSHFPLYKLEITVFTSSIMRSLSGRTDKQGVQWTLSCSQRQVFETLWLLLLALTNSWKEMCVCVRAPGERKEWSTLGESHRERIYYVSYFIETLRLRNKIPCTESHSKCMWSTPGYWSPQPSLVYCFMSLERGSEIYLYAPVSEVTGCAVALREWNY
jgi:hypothetical protein